MAECEYEMDDSFAHELAKIIRKLGYSDADIRALFNKSLLMSSTMNSRDFIILIMNQIGRGKTPKPINAQTLQDFETIRKTWFGANISIANRLLDKTFSLLYTTYL